MKLFQSIWHSPSSVSNIFTLQDLPKSWKYHAFASNSNGLPHHFSSNLNICLLSYLSKGPVQIWWKVMWLRPRQRSTEVERERSEVWDWSASWRAAFKWHGSRGRWHHGISLCPTVGVCTGGPVHTPTVVGKPICTSDHIFTSFASILRKMKWDVF